jgi:hypothetical protein
MKSLIIMLSMLFIPLNVHATTPEELRAAIQKAGGPEGIIADAAKAAARLAPRQIDSETEMTAAVGTHRRLVYYTRLLNYEKSEISDIASLQIKFFRQNAQAVCSAPLASILIGEYGVEYKYMVYSKSREYLFSYAYNKPTCNKLIPE